jgi:hypothetical protein
MASCGSLPLALGRTNSEVANSPCLSVGIAESRREAAAGYRWHAIPPVRPC